MVLKPLTPLSTTLSYPVSPKLLFPVWQQLPHQLLIFHLYCSVSPNTLNSTKWASRHYTAWWRLGLCSWKYKYQLFAVVNKDHCIIRTQTTLVPEVSVAWHHLSISEYWNLYLICVSVRAREALLRLQVLWPHVTILHRLQSWQHYNRESQGLSSCLLQWLTLLALSVSHHGFFTPTTAHSQQVVFFSSNLSDASRANLYMTFPPKPRVISLGHLFLFFLNCSLQNTTNSTTTSC